LELKEVEGAQQDPLLEQTEPTALIVLSEAHYFRVARVARVEKLQYLRWLE
jgi:hypothetical protein